ncbi:MAG: hypothetical protein H6739_38360 [Alphaproteobacteria bacterium]|nr:hypothetical protein [Alphaproteobacteria bacterium]
MPATYTLSAADFSRDFDALKGLILSEWPDIEAGALDATDGEVDEVVRVVAEQTDHSRTLVRDQLAELQHIHNKSNNGPSVQIERMLNRLETRVNELSGQVKDELVPQARKRAVELRDEARERAMAAKDQVEEKVHENLLVSLLIAVGFGFIIGLLLGGSRGR